MKILTILGTRPEIIRLCRIIEKLDRVSQHVVVHTGQNYDHNLNDVFFEELGVRAPDYFLGAQGSFGTQIGILFQKMEEIFQKERPDKFLVLGDTNSSLAAVVAKRLSIPVYHMEAGNRCYDDRVPEEVNRRIIDHSSDILLPYTERSRQNLLAEGIPSKRIYVTGNPIFEVIEHYRSRAEHSKALQTLGVAPSSYFLVTLHRAENVDVQNRVAQFVKSFEQLSRDYKMPVLISTHPRTRKRLQEFEIASTTDRVQFLEPFGFLDFLHLQQNAFCVLSDSGTVQEECAIFRKPVVTLRDATERPETLECGGNILSGADPDRILKGVEIMTSRPATWSAPPEYLVPHVSDTVLQLLQGYSLR